MFWLALLISAALHAAVLLGFNHRAPVKMARPAPDVVADPLLMVPLLEDLEEEKPRELVDDEQDAVAAPAVNVPMLVDVPVMIPSAANFIQPLDLSVPLKNESAQIQTASIPVNIQHGRPDESKIKNLFNVADLDRRPEPISRVEPVFPYAMRQQYPQAQVRVGFIIDTQGNVIMPYIISSPDREFSESTLRAVARWKFTPGVKGGRKVNSRAEQRIDFFVSEK